jgi:hypothetical protein
MASINSNPNAEITEDFVRHLVLSTILRYKQKFGAEYGQIVLAADDKNYWRRDIFPYYKANRKKSREKSAFDWVLIFETLNKIRDEIKQYFPYIYIQIPRAEADDIIGTLVEYSNTPLMQQEDILIISGDKDFIQLQRYNNVKQWSPMQKKYITHNNPKNYLKEHIMSGDSGDGVPNFLSDDDVFVTEGVRQKPLRKTKLSEWLNMPPEEFCDTKMLRNYKRNEQMIDLSYIPSAIKDSIFQEYKNGCIGDTSKLFNYFVKNKLKYLMESINDF